MYFHKATQGNSVCETDDESTGRDPGKLRQFWKLKKSGELPDHIDKLFEEADPHQTTRHKSTPHQSTPHLENFTPAAPTTPSTPTHTTPSMRLHLLQKVRELARPRLSTPCLKQHLKRVFTNSLLTSQCSRRRRSVA